MNKKIIIIVMLIGIGLLVAGPVAAKEKVKIKITTGDYSLSNKGIIKIKLVDAKGKSIKTSGKIYYRVTDSNGNYNWVKTNYKNEISLKYEFGKYKVKVKFYGDSKYKKAETTKTVTVKKVSFNPYTYYDDHNWGLNQKIDDYIEDNYWDEEIYDDASTYDGEGP